MGKETCSAIGSSHCIGTKAIATPHCGGLCPQSCLPVGLLSSPLAQCAHGQHQPSGSLFHWSRVWLPLTTKLGQPLKDAIMEGCLLLMQVCLSLVAEVV